MDIQSPGLGTTPDYRKPEEEKRSTLAEHMTQQSKPTLRESVLNQVAGGINDPAAIQPNTMPVNERQWNLISRAASESEDPDAYLARYGAALTFSKEYGIPVDAALDNLDELASYLTGEPFKANKTGVQAIVDSFNAGRINMQYSDLAYKFKQADLKGEDTSAIMAQLEEYASQIAALQDHQPRNIATTAIKWTAEGALPYMIEVGKSSLIGATAAGALATGFTAATGVALGSLAAATPWSLAAIISMGATVGAVNRTRELTEGVTYLQLRELGIDKDIANMGSRTIGMVVGAIEAGLGIEVGTVVKAVGGEQAVTAAASKATAKLIGSGKLGTFIQGVAALGVNATNEAIEEMSEEVAEYLVRHVSYAWQETRGPIDPMPDENLMRDTLQAGLMGFGSAIVLGAPSAMMDSGISIRQQSAMRQDAKTIPSKEAFVNAMSDVRPENIEAADWSNTMSTLWEREHKGKTESSSIKSDQAAYNELDSGKGKTPSGTVRRLNSGRLYTAESENTTVDTSGAEHRRLLVGDPVSGARYGYIDYSVKDNDLAINDVMVRSGYENMRKEAVLDLIEKYPGYEVTWEAKGDALADVRQQIIAANPRGQEGGLQYRDGITDVDERLAIESQIERAMPNLSAPERAVGAILVQLRAESEGTSAQGWLDSHFRDGQLFGDNSEIGKAMQGKRGAVSFDQDLKAIIYAGENADFSTFAHETFHVMLRNMDQIDQFRQAVSEAAATPEFMTWLSEHAQIFADGYFAGMDAQQLAEVAATFSQDRWGRTQEEFAARLYEGYLADGKTASTRLQQLFQQIAQWMRKVYNSLKHSVDLDPRIVEVFDSMLDKDSPLADQQQTDTSLATPGTLNQYEKEGWGRGYDSSRNMSVNAIDAYDRGVMPKHKWTKTAFSAIWSDLTGLPLPNLSADELKSSLLKSDEWHHTGKNYKSTNFYHFSLDAARALVAGERGHVYELEYAASNAYNKLTNWVAEAMHDKGVTRQEAIDLLEAEERRPAEEKPAYIYRGIKRPVDEAYINSIKSITDEDVNYYNFGRGNDTSWMDSAAMRNNESLMEQAGYYPTTLFQDAPPTDSEAFKAWFGDSKVVDEDGEPLVVYHATDAIFESFDFERLGEFTDYNTSEQSARNMARLGVWSSVDPVNKFTSQDISMPLYYKIENPLSTYFDALWAQASEYESPEAFKELFTQDGYDGLIVQDTEFDTTSFVAFSPEQIKSINNHGTWNATNPNMLFQDAPVEDSKEFRKIFKDTRAVDSDGKPALLYHGSPRIGLEALDNTGQRRVNGGEAGYTYATNSFDAADRFAYEQLPGSTSMTYVPGGRGQVYEIYMNIKNPLDFRSLSDQDVANIKDAARKDGAFPDQVAEVFDKFARGEGQYSLQYLKRQAEDIVRRLSEYGYDGLITELDNNGNLEYAAVSPSQVYMTNVTERTTLLFQDGPPITEAVLDDARGMASWEEFMDFYQAFAFGDDVVPTDEAWYQQVFNEANGITVTEEVGQERLDAARRQLESEDAKDEYMRGQLSTDSGVISFLRQLGYMLSNRAIWDTESNYEFADILDEVRRNAGDLVHPTILANAFRVEGGRTPTQRAIKSIRTLMTGDAIRYYRDVYALVMEDLELRPEVIDSRLPPISDPGINTLDNLSITERLKLANRIEATELKKALLSGKETMDGAAEKIIRDLDLQIGELGKKISEQETAIDESTKKFSETERHLLNAYREQREAKKQLDEQIARVRNLTEKGHKIPVEELKRTRTMQDKLQKLDDQVMAMREGMREKARQQHQAAMEAQRQKFKQKSADARTAATIKRQEAVAEQKRKSSEKAAEARLNATVKRQEALDKLKGQLTEKQRQKAEAQRVRKYKLDVARRIMAKPSDAINWEQAVMIYELQAALDPAFRRESTLIDGADGQRRVSIDDARELFSGSSREEIIEAIGLRMYEWIADERRPLNEWTVAELEDLAERVGNLRAEGRRILAAKVERQQAIASRYQENIMRTLIASGKYQDRPIVGSVDDQKEKSSPFRTAKSLRYSTLPMRAKAMMLDGDTQGVAYNLLITKKRQAQAVEWTAVELRQKPVIDFMKEVGLTERDLYETVGISLDLNTGTRFTYSALMYAWLSQYDRDNRNAVAYGNLVTQSEKADLNHDDGMIMALGDERYRNLITQAEHYLNEDGGRYMQVLERVRADFNGQRDRINEVAIREFNRPMRNVDEYLPIHRREFSGQDMDKQIADDWFNQNAGGNPTGVTKGFTRDRIKISPKHQRPVNLDLMQVWNRSVRDQEHFIAFAEYGRELNRVFKNPGSTDLKNVIDRTLGHEMVTDIHDYMNTVINPRRNIDQAGAQKAIRFMRGNLGAAYLTWKMSSLVLQTITSPAPFLQEVKPLYMAKGYIELFSHPLEAIAWINERSPMMKNRTMNVIIDEILQQSRTYHQSKLMHGVHKMQEIGGMGLTLVDRYAVAGGWLGAYHQRMDALMEQGITGAQAERMAIDWADDITLKTQPTGDVTEIAPLFVSGGEWARAFMQFTTSLNVIWTNLTYDMPVSARATMDQTAPADARMAQFSRVVGTIVGYGLAGAVLGAVADGYDDDDDEIDKLRKWIYWSTTQANESVPLFGNHVSEIIKTLVTGDKPDFFADEFFPGMMKIFKGVGYLAQGELTKALDNLAQGAGYMGGVPVSGIKQAIKTVKEGPGAMLGR